MEERPAVPPLQVRRATGTPPRAVPTGRQRTRPLGDEDLADEIELYGAVVVAASAKDGELSRAEIDDALGVPAAPSGARRGAGDERPDDS